MQLKLEEFKPIVSTASAFTAKRDIVPILGHLIFEKKQLAACDGISGAVMSLPWDFGEGFTLHAERLSRLLGAMAGFTDELDITNKNDGKINISGGGFEANFAVLKRDEFPYPKLPPLKSFKEVNEEWGKIIGRTLFSVSQDETKPGLRGIWVAGGLARSSDNYRITRIKCTSPQDIMLPEPLLSRLGGAVGTVEKITQTENLVILATPLGQFFTSKIATDFPSIDSIFDKSIAALKADKTLMLVEDPKMETLAMALRRVLLFSEGDLLSRIIVTLSKEKGIRIETPEKGLEKASEEVQVPIKARKAEIVFHVDGKKFLEVWEQCPRFYVSEDPNIPLYFESKDQTFQHVLVKLLE